MTDSTPLQFRQPYGPTTPAVRRFLVQLAALDSDAHGDVLSRFETVRNSHGFAAADGILGQTIERSGREDARDAVAGPLLQLVRFSDEADDLDPIAEPALAALLALIVCDLLAESTFATLYMPFERAIPLATVR